MNKNATFTMLVSAEQKEKAMNWCKDNDTTLSREVRKLINELAKKHDEEKGE